MQHNYQTLLHLTKWLLQGYVMITKSATFCKYMFATDHANRLNFPCSLIITAPSLIAFRSKCSQTRVLVCCFFPDCGIDAHSLPPFKVWKQHMVVMKCANAEPCDNHCKLSSSDFINGTVTYTSQMNWWPYSSRGVDNFWEVGAGLSLYRAARSNLRMVMPSSMLVVKLLIIRVYEASSKILDLATYLVVKWRSHCTSPLN